MLHDLIESLLNVDELFYLGKYAFSKNEKRWWLNVRYFSDLEKKYITFCYDTLRDVSRSFYGVIMEIPQTLSLDVAIFYLVLRALDTVEDDITSFQASKEARAEYLRNFYKSFTLSHSFLHTRCALNLSFLYTMCVLSHNFIYKSFLDVFVVHSTNRFFHRSIFSASVSN